MRTTLFFLFVVVVIIGSTAMAGCAQMFPMSDRSPLEQPAAETTEQMWRNARIAMATGNTVAAVKDTTIHEVVELQLGCGDMLARCYAAVPVWARLLGGFAMACTEYDQLPGARKRATIIHCALTDPFTMDHERMHAKGHADAF